jgi:hypothetical protein
MSAIPVATTRILYQFASDAYYAQGSADNVAQVAPFNFDFGLMTLACAPPDSTLSCIAVSLPGFPGAVLRV